MATPFRLGPGDAHQDVYAVLAPFRSLPPFRASCTKLHAPEWLRGSRGVLARENVHAVLDVSTHYLADYIIADGICTATCFCVSVNVQLMT